MFNNVKEYYNRLRLIYVLEKRYNFSTKFHTRKGEASFSFKSWGGNVFAIKVFLCLWDEDFYVNLFHEVGHVVDAKLTRGWSTKDYKNSNNIASLGNKSWFSVDSDEGIIQGYIKSSGNTDYAKLLVKEARASRFAIRALKSLKLYNERSTPLLERCLGTYCKYMDTSDIADITYKLINYMKGK